MKIKALYLLPFMILLLGIVSVTDVEAQCAMCRATVENNVSSGESRVGAGLNSGILYLMSMPYLIFVVIGYFWYKNSRKSHERNIRIAGLHEGKMP
jgi:hypothetical protein